MDADIPLRRLVAPDAAAYRGLMLDGYRTHPEAFTASVEERGDLPLAWWEARLRDEFVVGAWSDGRLVGVAGLVAEARPKTRHKATLYGMHVAADHARRGIGERLVRVVLDHATAQVSLRVVQLTVTDGNRSAQTLYERCGFVAYGLEPFGIAVDDGYRAKLHMWIDLAPARTGEAKRHEAAHA